MNRTIENPVRDARGFSHRLAGLAPLIGGTSRKPSDSGHDEATSIRPQQRHNRISRNTK